MEVFLSLPQKVPLWISAGRGMYINTATKNTKSKSKFRPVALCLLQSLLQSLFL